MPCGPRRQVDQVGELGDVTVLTYTAIGIGIGGRCPHMFGDDLDGLADLPRSPVA